MGRQVKTPSGGKENRYEAPGKHSRFGRIVLGFFFLSGFTSLVYEILWSRMIVSVIGSAPFAVSIVLSAFMGGLGVGSLWGAKLTARISRPGTLVTIYGLLELAIGFYGLMLPFLIAGSKPFFAILYNSAYGHSPAYHLFAFAGCALLLIAPTVCMGATLPVMIGYTVNRRERLGGQAGLLYGVNTVGAAAGSLLTGFVLIKILGVNGSLWFAVALNGAVGFGAIVIGRLAGGGETAGEHPAADISRITVSGAGSILPSTMRGVLGLFAVSGFCGMATEVIWTRLLGLVIGPTTYSFTIVVTSYVLGLAAGSFLFGRIADRVKNPLALLLITQTGAALAVVWVSHLLGNSQIFFAKLIARFTGQFMMLSGLKALILFSMIVIPTVLFGAAFPLVMKIITPSLERVGRSAGFAVALNTAGAVAGAFAAGFLLIPLAGKEGSIRLIALIQFASAILVGVITLGRGRNALRALVPSGVVAIFGIILVGFYPYWNRDLLSVGRYHRIGEEQVVRMGWLEALFFGTGTYEGDPTGELVYFGDGIGGFTTVKRTTDIIGKEGFSLYNSGKSDASTDAQDLFTETMLAHVPLLFHERPDTVMVLGLASGITAGEVLRYPVEKLDIVDINRQVVEASDFFRPWNNNVLDDPRTELIIQDGRAHLELTGRRYDVIVSEPSNPWMAGLAALFTRDFFTMARERLAPGGVFVQWLHAYQIDWDTFAMVGRTFAEVFPRSVLVDIDPAESATDYLLVGFNGEGGLDPDIARLNLKYTQKSPNIVLTSPLTFYRLVVSDDLVPLFGEGPVHTDDNPRLEFSAPRVMHVFDMEKVYDRVMKNGRLSGTMAALKDSAANSVSEQIDYAAFALSFERPSPGMVDLGRATEQERDHYRALLAWYCSSHYVNDFRFIGDSELEQVSIRAQLSFMKERVKDLVSPVPIYEHIANLHMALEEYGEAAGWYLRALEVAPDNGTAHYNIGRALTATGDFAEAEHHYRESIRIDPYHTLSYNNLANLLARQGALGEAVPLYREALMVDSTLAVAHRNLGIVLRELGRKEESDFHLEEADRLEGNAE